MLLASSMEFCIDTKCVRKVEVRVTDVGREMLVVVRPRSFAIPLSRRLGRRGGFCVGCVRFVRCGMLLGPRW